MKMTLRKPLTRELHDDAGKDFRRPLRVTFLAVIPSPYMVDLFEAIDQDPRFCLRVHYLEKPAMAAPGVYWKEKPLPPYASVLPGGKLVCGRTRIHVNSGLLRTLDQDAPDVVVVMGYFSLTHQFAMYWLWLKRIPWVFWGEVPGMEQRGAVGTLLRWLALRPVACLADGIAAIGSRAAAAYVRITNRGRPVWSIPYYCQTQALLNIRRSPDAVDDVAHFLFCGQIVPRKGVDLLVKSFCRLAREHDAIRLTVVGDGPLREPLTALVPEAIRHRVTWAGFKEVEELPPFFAVANIFVLPSLHDGWGLVINQAVSAGMAVIASDAVGAAVDLVEHGVSGLIFPARAESALTAAMGYFAEHPEVIYPFGQKSRERARPLSPRSGADRWYRFSQKILNKQKVPALSAGRSVQHHVPGT